MSLREESDAASESDAEGDGPGWQEDLESLRQRAFLLGLSLPGVTVSGALKHIALLTRQVEHGTKRAPSTQSPTAVSRRPGNDEQRAPNASVRVRSRSSESVGSTADLKLPSRQARARPPASADSPLAEAEPLPFSPSAVAEQLGSLPRACPSVSVEAALGG